MSKTIVSIAFNQSTLTFDARFDCILYLRDISKVDRLLCRLFFASELFLHGGYLFRNKKHSSFLSYRVILADVDILIILLFFYLINKIVLKIGLRNQRVCSLDVHFFHETAHFNHYFYIRRLLLSILALFSIFVLLRELFVFFTIGIMLVRLLILTIFADALMKPHPLAVQIIFAEHKFSRTSSVFGSEATLQSAIRTIKRPL